MSSCGRLAVRLLGCHSRGSQAHLVRCSLLHLAAIGAARDNSKRFRQWGSVLLVMELRHGGR